MKELKKPFIYSFSIILIGILLFLAPVLGSGSIANTDDDSDISISGLNTYPNQNGRNTTNNKDFETFGFVETFEWAMTLVFLGFVYFRKLTQTHTQKFHYYNVRAPPLD